MKIWPFNRLEKRIGIENPQVPVTAPAIIQAGGGAGINTIFGNLTEAQALSISAVYACTRVISETLATVESHVYLTDGVNKKRARELPIYSLLTRSPNGYMSATTFYELMLYMLCLRGNFFCHIQRNPAGEPLALIPLRTEQMKISLNNGVKTYIYSQADDTYTLPDSDVLHVLGLSHDGIVGLSPMQFMRNSVGLAASMEEYTSRYFFQGVKPGLVLSSKSPLTDENRKQLHEGLAAGYGGLKGVGKALLLPGNIEILKPSIDPLDAELLKSRQFTIEEICRWFRLRPGDVGVFEKVASGAAVLSAMQFVQNSILPWAVKIETEIGRKLLADDVLSFAFDLTSLYRADIQATVTMLVQQHAAGVISGNEFRSGIGLPQVDDPVLNIYMVPATVQNAKNLLAPPAPAPAPNPTPTTRELPTEPTAATPADDQTSRKWLVSELSRVYRRHRKIVSTALAQGKDVSKAIQADYEPTLRQVADSLMAACRPLNHDTDQEGEFLSRYFIRMVELFGQCRSDDDLTMQEGVFDAKSFVDEFIGGH